MNQSEAQAFIGLCRFERAFDQDGNALMPSEEQTLETFEAPIACWSTSAQQYDEMLTHLLPDQGYRLLRTEDVMPAQTWFEMKGFHQALADLTTKVHNRHRAEIGALHAVGFEQSHGLEGTANPESAQDPLIITEHPITPLPDQSKIWPPSNRQWISEDVKELLFGQELPKEHQHILGKENNDSAQNTNPSLIRTYFIADATLRKKITKVFDLDMDFPKRPAGADWIEGYNGNRGNIQYRSLFKGEAQEELKEVAPYLIDMTLPERAYEDPTYVPDFHKSFFQSTWDQALKDNSKDITHLDTGIFIRTTADFDEVWKRFRKFTRIQDENDKWYYWRFWQPLILSKTLILSRINDLKSLKFHGNLHISFKKNAHSSKLDICSIKQEISDAKNVSNLANNFQLKNYLSKGYAAIIFDDYVKKILNHIKNSAVYPLHNITESELSNEIEISILNGENFGFTQTSSLTSWAIASFLLGKDFYKSEKILNYLKLRNADEFLSESEKSAFLIKALTNLETYLIGRKYEKLEQCLRKFLAFLNDPEDLIKDEPYPKNKDSIKAIWVEKFIVFGDEYFSDLLNKENVKKPTPKWKVMTKFVYGNDLFEKSFNSKRVFGKLSSEGFHDFNVGEARKYVLQHISYLDEKKKDYV